MMVHDLYAKIGNIQLKPLQEKDLECLRRWRNDRNISRFLKKIDIITVEQQEEWYRSYLSSKEDYYWTIWEDDRIIGSLSIYNLNGTYADIGRILIGDLSARGKGYGYYSFLMAIKIGFEIFGLEIISLNVHEKNKTALSIYKKVGFYFVCSHPFDYEGCEYEMQIDKTTFFSFNNLVDSVEIFEN